VSEQKPPLPPFTEATAREKVKKAQGLMRRRDMSANDIPIEESERRHR
jgi:nuclear transport factor 2 (NTF2) superfamily protein